MKGISATHVGDEVAGVAADWLLRLDDPALSEEDLQAWLEWFSASDDNRRAFDQLQTVRRRLRGMPEERRQQLIDRTLHARPSLAAAFRERLYLPRSDSSQADSSNADSPTSDFLGPDLSRTARDAGRWRVAWALAASLIVAVGLGLWIYPMRASTTTYAASSDQHRTVTLSDGSALVLDSQAIVDVTFTRKRRSLSVHQGKAYFEVTSDPARPFVVAAAGVEVAAVGTAFSVQREADRVVVTVTHGRVRVTNTSTGTSRAVRSRAPVPVANVPGAGVDLELSQGQQTRVALPAMPEGEAGSVRAPVQGWVDGRAEFVNAPLRDVLAVVNQYAPTPVVIDDPRVGDLTFSGTIFRSHVDEWVASLPYVYPIEMVALDNATVTLISRRGESP